MQKHVTVCCHLILLTLIAGSLMPMAVEAEPENVHIQFMNWWGAGREALMDEVIANFQQEHPDILVENLVQPWDTVMEAPALALSSRTPPALIMVPRSKTYKFAHQGLIVPITKYVDAAGLDLDDIFYPSEIDDQRWGGELWSFPLPTGGGVSGQYFYQKRLLQQAGFDPETPPTTWQELEQVAEAVTQTDAFGLMVLGVDVGTDYPAFISWLYTNNGKLVSDDGKTALFNSPEGIETLEWMVRFTNTYNGGIEQVRSFGQGVSGSSSDFPFYTGHMAIWFKDVSTFGHMKDAAEAMWKDPSQWGVALRPYNGTNPEASHHGISGLWWSWGYVIPKNLPQEVQDAAYIFLEYLGTHEQGGCQFVLAQGRPSPVKACNENPAYTQINPYWNMVLKSLESDVNIPITPVQEDMNKILNTAVEEAMFGRKRPADALNEAAVKSQKLLDAFWQE